ncbi:MAG: IgGFc-binding protein [Fibrobacterales bacterium]
MIGTLSLANCISIRSIFITLTFLVLGLLPQRADAQIDTLHYIPPIFGFNNSGLLHYALIISTLEPIPFEVEVTHGDGTLISTETVSLYSPVYVDLKNTGSLLVAQGGEAADPSGMINTILPSAGIKVHSQKNIFVNILYRDSPQGEVLTSKGTVGLGKEFFSGHMHSQATDVTADIWRKSHFISVMATENNTRVTIANPNYSFYQQTDTTDLPILNKGESYIVANRFDWLQTEYGKSDSTVNGFNGTHITSNNDIVVNTGTFHGGYSNGSNRDIGLDQIVPVEYAGTEFILIEGKGTEVNKGNEVAIIIATQNNTTFSVNGTRITTTIHKGEYHIVPWEYYQNHTMFIETSHDAFVYQTLAGNTGTHTAGMIFVPRLTDNATKEIYIAEIENIADASLYLSTHRSATLTINDDEVPRSLSIPINDTWVAYRIEHDDLIDYEKDHHDYHVTSTGPLNGAVSFSDGGAVGGGGYYSGFTLDNSNAGVGTIGITNYTLRCDLEIELLAQGGVDYEWFAPTASHIDLIRKKNDSTYVFEPSSEIGEGPFVYTVTVFVENALTGEIEPKEKNLSIRVSPLDPEFGGDMYACIDKTITLNGTTPSTEADPNYTWINDQFLDSVHFESPSFYLPPSVTDRKLPFEVIYDDSHCKMTDIVWVTPENCDGCRVTPRQDTSIAVEYGKENTTPVTLSSEGRGTISHWSYIEDGDTIKLNSPSPVVTPIETTTYTVYYEDALSDNLDSLCTGEVTIAIEENEPVTPPAELNYAHVYDENGDGHADMMIVGFDRLLTSLPKSITSIDWPKDGKDKITAKEDWLEYLNEDSTAVIITFPKPFDFGTKGDKKSPPSLNYGSSSIKIEDRIGPVILKVEKRPPKHRYFAIQYDIDSLAYFPNSDTLIFHLSEDVAIDKKEWETTFIVVPDNGESHTLRLTERPSVDKDDESILYAFSSNAPDINAPLIGDEIGFSILNRVTDRYDNNASIQGAPLEGKDDDSGRVGHTFREPIVGTDNGEILIPVENVPVYDEDMNILENTTTYNVPLKNNWVPPVNFDPTTHKIIDRETCGEEEEKTDTYQDNTSPDTFNSACYSSLVFGSYAHEGPYTTKVFVYDHLGQFLDSWKQTFGKCGELKNEARESDIENYYLNDLVWDMKNSNGRRVGSGVFYWHVTTHFESGRTEKFITSMGIVRPKNECK